jgi:hypothetical protein
MAGVRHGMRELSFSSTTTKLCFPGPEQSYNKIIYISYVNPGLCPHQHGGTEENYEKPQSRELMSQLRDKTGST